MKTCAFFRDSWTVTENMCLRATTVSTQWAYTQDFREIGVGDGLVGAVPPQVPQMTHLSSASGDPALGELPRLSREGDGSAGPAGGCPAGGTRGIPRMQVVHERGADERRAETSQEWCLVGCDEVPVLGADRGLGEGGMW